VISYFKTVSFPSVRVHKLSRMCHFRLTFPDHCGNISEIPVLYHCFQQVLW
jgi:hypothetical protein